MTNSERIRDDLKEIRKDVEDRTSDHLELLEKGLQASFEELASFQSWIGEQMSELGMDAEQFTVGREELSEQPAYQKTLREDPSALRSAPNMVGTLQGSGEAGGILLFAHADKRPETFDWGRQQSNMVEKEGQLFGPGIADDVSGITAMLSAVETFQRMGYPQAKDLMVASVLGKQMGVFGTYGLMTRYGPMDAAIYVHPAESGDGLAEVKMASLGLLEFLINIQGKGPDTTDPHQTIFSTSAVSAAEKGVQLFQELHAWADEVSERYHHAGLEKMAQQSFALTFGRFLSGADNEVFEIPVRCMLEGTVCFPPEATLDGMKIEFRQAFESAIRKDAWIADSHASLEWGDHVGESVQADEDSSFLRMASEVLEAVKGIEPHYYYGHSVSDIRYPLLYWDAQAFGVGPVAGDIGKQSEWVDRDEYIDTIVAVTQMLKETVA
jgi:acetylornithine deacetylase/succinyl-diaminopimelate desuccinylase-like protein